MDGRGSKNKGSRFERLVCTTLSLWVTNGARTDAFNRNVLSGGRFTLASAKGRQLGMPGDIAAGHPSAFDFLSVFLVECKHHKDLDVIGYVFDQRRRSFLSRVRATANAQAALCTPPLRSMVVARQNRYPALVMLDHDVGMVAARMSRLFQYHAMHNNDACVTTLDNLVGTISPAPFISHVRTLTQGVK